jgi:CBS-domain-containing membrane protein
MNAAAVMTRDVVTVGHNTSVSEIAGLLLERKISAVPVIDNEHRVIGIVSEGDLLGRPTSGSPRAGGCGCSTRMRHAWRRSRPPAI